MKTSILSTSETLERTFLQCCDYYSKLDIYVAWVGIDRNLQRLMGQIKKVDELNIVAGVAFSRSHPGALRKLSRLANTFRIAYETPMYHPKVYLFSKGKHNAIIIGSSNFTYAGFYENTEVNVLIEYSSPDNGLKTFIDELSNWKSDALSFIPDKDWFHSYEIKYRSIQRFLKKNKVKTDVIQDELYSTTPNWLGKADWETYMIEMNSALKFRKKIFGDGLDVFLKNFQEYDANLGLPWDVGMLDDKYNRTLIAGRRPFGRLGHVGASGHFNHLLVNGTKRERTIIVDSINELSKVGSQIDYEQIRKILKRLVKLNCSMKVWGRLMAITRPDLYCTISSNEVRVNIGKILGVNQKELASADGYIKLLKYIHKSPWFNSKRPANQKEHEIWKRRVALIDIIFYNEIE